MGNTAVVSVLQSFSTAMQEIPGIWPSFEVDMLIAAARLGNLNVLKSLLAIYNPTNPVDSMSDDKLSFNGSTIVVGERALMQAIDSGHTDIVMHLLDYGISSNGSVSWDSFDTDRGLQENSKTPEFSSIRISRSGCSALHLAIANGNSPTVKLLLEVDADPNQCIYSGQMELKASIERLKQQRKNQSDMGFTDYTSVGSFLYPPALELGLAYES
jgi:ankyrin repeat protein